MTTLDLPIGQFTLRPLNLERDGERLAAMWQASNDQWPGTVSDGAPITPEWAIEREKNVQTVQTLVWASDNVIAGYCSYWALPEEANVYYIATLNVPPQYQGFGLARRFLQHYVDETIRRGGIRLDLNTWAGNLKAMPLYKRCGFFWAPRTSVHMVNFLPVILQLPCTRDFFARNAWYTSMQRALTQTEDDETWEGMGIYTYRFVGSDGEELLVRVDREACRITAVETAAFAAAAMVANQQPPRGLPLPIRWRITNRRAAPLPISLFATGTPDLRLERRETLTLAPGETRESTDAITIAEAMADPKKDRPAPFVRTILVIDGDVLELGTGMRPGAAIEIESIPEYITLMPGIEQAAELQLRSRLDQPISATVALAPAPGLTANWGQQEVQLPAHGVIGLPVTLKAEQAGVLALAVTVRFPWGEQSIQLPIKNRLVFALAPGGILGAHEGEKLRIETETLRILLESESAALKVVDRANNEELVGEDARPAPPTMPSEYWDARFDLRLEQRGTQLVALAEYASQQNPGFLLRKEVQISADGSFQIAYEFDNRSTQPYTFHLAQYIDIMRDDRAMLTLPLADGPVQAPFQVFPNMADDRFTALECHTARWAALQCDQTVVGVLWDSDLVKLEFTWGMTSHTREYVCPPGTRVRPGARWLWIGSGDWRTVEQRWRRMQNLPLDPLSTLHAPLEARFNVPLAALDGTVDATLLVRHSRSRPASGTITLELPDGWQAEPDSVPFDNLTWQTPLDVPVRLNSTSRPGAFAGRVRLDSAETDITTPLTLVHLGSHSGISISDTEAFGQRIVRIANGRIELDVAPAFGGVVVALREGGVNHLATRFPEVATLGWLSPWHGGLSPVLVLDRHEPIPGLLLRQEFAVEPISRDIAGITWYGVQQRTVLNGERQDGIIAEIETLTLGDSPLVRQSVRLINPTSASRQIANFGWGAFVQPDGSSAATTLWGAHGQQLKQNDRITWLVTGHLVAAQNPATGRTLALVSPEPLARMASWGADGAHMALFDKAVLPTNGSLERIGYLVLAETLDEALRYEVLRDLR